MKQSVHLNPSEETRTGFPVTSNYGRAPPNKHGGVGRQQQQQPYGGNVLEYGSCYGFVFCEYRFFLFPHMLFYYIWLWSSIYLGFIEVICVGAFLLSILKDVIDAPIISDETRIKEEPDDSTDNEQG